MRIRRTREVIVGVRGIGGGGDEFSFSLLQSQMSVEHLPRSVTPAPAKPQFVKQPLILPTGKRRFFF